MSCDCQYKQDKLVNFVTTPCGSSSCDDADAIAFSARPDTEKVNEPEESFYEDMTPQGKLECLKQTLKLKIRQMRAQDDTIQGLECQLEKAKKDLTALKEKFDGKTRHLNELSQYESRLKNFREILLRSTYNLEKVSRSMSSCQFCNRCTCKQVTGDEGSAVDHIKRDLESLQLKKSTLESHQTSESTTNASDGKRDQNIKKFQPLSEHDADDFRIKAVTGVAALEEMKEQIDILHGLIKKHYLQLPRDYEKSQIEECENKFNKLHDEFDVITDGLCELIESFTSTGSGKKESVSDQSQTINLPEKVTRLQGERQRLQKEIGEQRAQLERIKGQIIEVERELQEKRCESAEQDKEIKSRDQEISRLREGVKGFRDRLRDMQMDIADNVDGKTKLVPCLGSRSSLSVLSTELQELCEILTSSQSSFPGIIEKCKEQNRKMQKELNCLKTCLRNKDETLALLQKSLKMREGQVEDLNGKIHCLNAELQKLRKETEEKTSLICNLEDSVKKAKEFELKIKDDHIEELQFEICDLDFKLKATVKEIVKKGKELEVLQDEILYVSSKNFFMTREMDVLELKLGKLQKNLIIYEKTMCNLQNELKDKECENEQLYGKVRELEQELECELKKCEEKTQKDSECINELNVTIRNLENELRYVKCSTRRASPRSNRPEDKNGPCGETEDPCDKSCLKDVVRQLKSEVKALKLRLKQAEKQETSSKVADLENIIRQGECRQQLYNDKINELQKMLEETMTNQEREKEKLVKKLCKEENENVKNKLHISKLDETIKWKIASENKLKEELRCFACNLESMKRENEILRAEIDAGRERMRGRDRKNDSEMEERYRLISDLEAQKSDLKVKCSELKSELDKEEKMKKCLEEKIESLNDTLANKTLQLDQLSQNYKCTSAKAQEALTKLEDAEGRLKCLKMEMNTRRVCDEEEEEDDDDNEDRFMNERDLEDSLEMKRAECSDLMSEVQCLQVKLKALQGEYISAQANKDCELTRLNREITRLESELDLLDKENCKLRSELTMVKEELKNKSRADDFAKDELDKKDKELQDALSEKNLLLGSVDDLQKRLEEMCLDNARREKENRDLRDEYTRFKKELNDTERELCETRRDLEALRNQYAEATDKLKCTEKKMENFKELYYRLDRENGNLQEAKSDLEKDLCETKTENFMLKEKLLCAKRQKDAETKKLMAENSNAAQEKMRYCSKLKELSCKMKNLEENVIPHLEDEIIRKERLAENYKMELEDANASSQRMRDESLRVIQCTKKYLAAQKSANEGFRMRMDCSKDNRHYSNNEARELEEQLKRVARLNEHLYFDLQNEKNDYQDTEPRSFSPQPWGCPSMERDDSSPEYLPESGFQSMQQSPTNMNYISDYGPELKRKQSQWNSSSGRHTENSDYSPCRNSSVK